MRNNEIKKLLRKFIEGCLISIRAPIHRLRKRRLLFLCDEIEKIKNEPMIIKVGANDGVTGDPFAYLLRRSRKWKALFVEPVPYCIDKLKANFDDPSRFVIEAAAIGPGPEKATFYYVAAEAEVILKTLPPWYNQIGSFNKNHILNHFTGILEPFIREIEIDRLPLSKIFDRHDIKNLDLLQIDTEGYDLEVLKTINFQRHRPLIVFVEQKHLKRSDRLKMKSLLRRKGYCVRACGGDYIAIHNRGLRMLRKSDKFNSKSKI